VLIKIGDVEFAKGSDTTNYTVTKYSATSIGIRARVQSETDLKQNEEKLYRLREGRTQEIEILNDDGSSTRGIYKINELNWKKQRKDDGDYELVFNIGLQKQ
jgi:hypothetical protein